MQRQATAEQAESARCRDTSSAAGPPACSSCSTSVPSLGLGNPHKEEQAIANAFRYRLSAYLGPPLVLRCSNIATPAAPLRPCCCIVTSPPILRATAPSLIARSYSQNSSATSLTKHVTARCSPPCCVTSPPPPRSQHARRLRMPPAYKQPLTARPRFPSCHSCLRCRSPLQYQVGTRARQWVPPREGRRGSFSPALVTIITRLTSRSPA
jgi:hypothetical protein